MARGWYLAHAFGTVHPLLIDSGQMAKLAIFERVKSLTSGHGR